MNRLLPFLIVFGAGALPISATAAPPPNTPAQNAMARHEVETVCQNCHGPDGNSISPTFPRLNGQQAQYIITQLKSFRDHTRADPHAMAYMWGMSSQLSNSTITALANYLAAQKPTPAQPGGALAAEGKKLFMNGDPSHNVPACEACHGDHGQGNGQFPRLAGQHADYLRNQLENFRSLVRKNTIMHANTAEMTDHQIEAVVSYLAND